MNFTKENYFLFFILIVLALEAVLFSVGNNKLNIVFEKEEKKMEKTQEMLANIPIQAKAFSIYDQTLNKKIYGKNDKEEMPIASLVKIMTVITALNNHQVDDIVSISPEAIKQEGDYGFFVNEKFTIGDLAKFTLIGSANDGAYTLITEDGDDFLEKMNNKARKIGMENTLFFNFTGLDIDEGFAGAYASAEDVNIMAMYALKAYEDVFRASIMPEIKIKSESGKEHSIKNTDTILEKIPNILFSKTGFTPLAGGNLTVIYKDKYEHTIAITVLGSTQEERFSDVEKIIDALYNLN
jgi:D-alanyl-D-alanine carboxypeptidase (penicillin-binding protein 5/6)